MVAIEQGCVKVGDLVLVWGPEFTVEVSDEAMTAANNLTGERIEWRTGDEVTVGGGRVRLESFSDSMKERIGVCASLEGELWLMSGGDR
ncbi:MAG: hypothetical protein IT303_04050 [Dehalococcoidia bacterium]|nr:hypothetical protein [Dehalococcoidia bacterium]